MLATDEEFAELQTRVAGAEVDRISVSTAEDDGIRYYVTWFEATAADRAVVIPAFLVHEDLPALRTRTQREGVMYRHVRTLAADEAVSFRHDDPESFF